MPEKDNKIDKPISKTSVIMFFLLVLVIGIVAFLVYLKSSDVDLRKVNLKEFIVETLSKDEKTAADRKILELSYEEKSYPAFDTYKGLIIKCTKDYIKAISKKGEEVWVKNVSLNNPLIKTNGSDMLVADLGGRSIYVFKGENIKWEGKTDSDIVNADLNRNGYVTLVQEVEGYRNKIKVYDPYGVEMFYRNIAENFVLDANVSPSGEQIVINSVNTSGISIKSKLEFIRMLDENPFAAVIKEERIFPSIWFLNDDSLIAVSDSYLACYDKNRSEVWNKTIQKIYSSNVCLGKYIVIAAAGIDENEPNNSSKVKVEILNARGQQLALYPVEGKVRNIRTYSDIIAVNTGREVHFINTRGKLKNRTGSRVDILDVRFINKLEAVIITKNSIQVVNIG